MMGDADQQPTDPPEHQGEAAVPPAEAPGPASAPDASVPTTTATTPQLPDPTPPTPQRWRYAPRPRQWTPLKHPPTWPLWLLGLGTLVLAYGLVLTSFYWVGQLGSQVLFSVWRYFTWVRPPVGLTLGLLGLCLTVAPWGLRWSLGRLGAGRPWSLADWRAQFPETARLLERWAADRHWPPVRVWWLDSPVTAVWSFGWLPRAQWLVITAGAQAVLDDRELAAVVAQELSRRSLVCLPLGRTAVFLGLGLLSGLTLLLQMPYLTYVHLARLGERWPRLGWLTGTISWLFYGLWWWWRWAGLGFARILTLYADRRAMQLVPDPNALARAILKLNMGTATVLQEKGSLPHLYDLWELLLPVHPRWGVFLGTVPPEVPWEQVLRPRWPWLNLSLAQADVTTRLGYLMQIAQQWRVPPEVTLGVREPLPWRQHALYLAPWLGLGLGWLVGWFIGLLMGWLLSQPDQWVAVALAWFGWGCGTLVRINFLYPDIPRMPPEAEPEVVTAVTVEAHSPAYGQPKYWQGQLLGRLSWDNALGQDLWLATRNGTIPLHYQPSPSYLLHLWLGSRHPVRFVGKTVAVQGWLRWGATPWLDVEQIETRQGKKTRGGHPIWATLAAFAAIAIGVYILGFVGVSWQILAPPQSIPDLGS
jgi:Zn-dependent protease with chaperone function